MDLLVVSVCIFSESTTNNISTNVYDTYASTAISIATGIAITNNDKDSGKLLSPTNQINKLHANNKQNPSSISGYTFELVVCSRI